MPKATIKLPDGTSVEIDGSPEEVAKLLALYGGQAGGEGSAEPSNKKSKRRKGIPKKKKASKEDDSDNPADLAAIIEQIKN